MTREKYSGTFDGCKLWLDYTLEGGDVVWRKWGDYFFGLALGAGPGNGGWNRWCFLRVLQRTPKGLDRVVSRSRPDVFFGYSAEGADFIVGEWAGDGGKRLRLRFAAHPAHRDWLFLKVEFGGFDVERVELVAYPGNVVAPECRETHMATKERDWTLNEEGADFAPSSPLVMLYSRYFDERYGNKVVFDAAPVKSVVTGKTTSEVTLGFLPKPGAKSMEFALGYFADKDYDDQRVRFLGEDGDAIHAFLRSVDWEAVPKIDDFKLSVGIAHEMGVPLKSLKPSVDRFKAARKARDMPTLATCVEEVLAMRRETAAEGLKAFSKPKTGK